MISATISRWALTVAVVLLWTTAAVAQSLTLRLIDAEDGLPISACHVLVSDSAIGSTNSQGKWIVPKHLRSNTVTLSHVSYGQQHMNLSALPNGTVDIALQAQGYNISEVKVKGKHKKVKLKKMGITRTKSDLQNFLYYGFGLKSKKLLAVYIENTEPAVNYYLQQLLIYINPSGVPTAPFLVSLCEAQAAHIAPDTANKLLYGPLLTHAERGGAYHRINLAHLKLKMPTGGIYVVLRNCPSNSYVECNPIVMEGVKIPGTMVNQAIVGKTYGKYTNKFLHWEHRKPYEHERRYHHPDITKWIRDTLRVIKHPEGGIRIQGEPMVYVTLKKVE